MPNIRVLLWGALAAILYFTYVAWMHDYQPALPSVAKGPERTIHFSLPIFEYHRQHRRMGEARMGARGRAIIHEHLRRALSELIADDVRKEYKVRRKAAGQIPPDLLVQYVASTFILVLNWWVESRRPLPPNEVNDLFRELVLPTLATTLARMD